MKIKVQVRVLRNTNGEYIEKPENIKYGYRILNMWRNTKNGRWVKAPRNA